MPATVAGQFFEIVTCQACETDLPFQKAAPPKRLATGADELEITCRSCGHLGFYRPAHIRPAQAQYPL